MKRGKHKIKIEKEDEINEDRRERTPPLSLVVVSSPASNSNAFVKSFNISSYK
jgi:hypothetical protein